jgi:hypothetical protein
VSFRPTDCGLPCPGGLLVLRGWWRLACEVVFLALSLFWVFQLPLTLGVFFVLFCFNYAKLCKAVPFLCSAFVLGPICGCK